MIPMSGLRTRNVIETKFSETDSWIFDFYVIFIDIAPTRIDVNVHPTKTEIKFEDERMIYAIVAAMVKKALATHHVMPSIDFEHSTSLDFFAAKHTARTTPPNTLAEKNIVHFTNQEKLTRQEDAAWERLATHGATSFDNPTTTRSIPSMLNANEAAETTAVAFLRDENIKIQLHKRYILTQLKSGLLLIDQKAAHERILYERYLQLLQSNKARNPQQLLFPVSITLNPADLTLLQAHIQEIQALGFVLASFGKNNLMITGCPEEIVHHDLQQLLEDFVEQFKWNHQKLTLPIKENIARSLARRAGMQPGKKLQPEEMNALVDQLFACTQPRYTPTNRKTFVVITSQEIKTLFGS